MFDDKWIGLIGTLIGFIGLLMAFFGTDKNWFKKKYQDFRAQSPNKQYRKITLESPDSPLSPNSEFYILRPPIETDACDHINKDNALLRIKGARKSGKTSLLKRILKHAKTNNKIVSLNLALLEPSVYKNENTFYRWFCQEVIRQLKLDLNYAWDKNYSAAHNAKCYFEDEILPKVETALLIAIDDADYLFQHPNIAHNFYKSLRVWHEAASSPDQIIWQKFRLILLHSQPRPTTLNNSPFENVGLGIEIPAFNTEQIQQLLTAHGLRWRNNEFETMYQLLGGQAYLWRICLHRIINDSTETYQSILDKASSDAGIFSEYLQDLNDQINRKKLNDSLHEITHRDELTKDRKQLVSLGLVEAQADAITPSCQLYQDYFKSKY